METRQRSRLQRLIWVVIFGALAARAVQRVARVKPPTTSAPGKAVWNPLDFSKAPVTS